ncbi:hypothetical protein RvY_00295-1 [Ramazzottius varieornatus]|uniref:BRCT domain-containing protein n=1 Tax=Ramazzottius varieornatus TaxID=947166 RepID=A0A1D1UFZ1_RAMVA|nr:hypothetical protein RvY_00295-1 [Ramazzottius varieornatus]
MMVDQVDMDTHLKRVQPVPFNKLLDGCLFTTTHPNITRSSSSEEEEAEYRAGDLDERIRTWVAQMGGKMVAYFEELTDIQFANPKKRFLITSACCRTQRYLECLVANVPCIEYHWLKSMYYRGKMIDFEKYRLPAGYDSRGRVVEWIYR